MPKPANLLVFSRASATHPVLFAVSNEGFPRFDLIQFSPAQCAQDNGLVQHETFDWEVNKGQTPCFLCEHTPAPGSPLPTSLLIAGNTIPVTWLPFPTLARRALPDNQKNNLQLAVQYVSAGGVDQSVIAADGLDVSTLNSG